MHPLSIFLQNVNNFVILVLDQSRSRIHLVIVRVEKQISDKFRSFFHGSSESRVQL